MTPAWPRLLLLLLTERSSALSHPCHSDRGRDTDICRQLASLCHQTEIKMAVCDLIEAEERIDVGIALLEPSADIKLSAPTGPGNFLASLADIPGDLVDFYTDFGFHVRRGWQTLQRNVGAENFFSGIASYLPRSKIDDEEDPDDDPNSPYSINYSGEFNKNQGYSYIIQNKNGNHTGYVSFPDLSQSKLNVTQPKG